MRGGAAAARWAHNPKVGGSNPPPATKQAEEAVPRSRGGFFVGVGGSVYMPADRAPRRLGRWWSSGDGVPVAGLPSRRRSSISKSLLVVGAWRNHPFPSRTR